MITEELARGAARWWARNLNGGHDNGDPMTGGFAAALSALAGGPYRPTPDELQRFEDALTGEILSKPHDRGALTISVDYHPCAMLERAATAAGFGEVIHNMVCTPIPIKTCMNIFEAYAVAGLGYGAPFEVVAGEKPLHLETDVAPAVTVTTESWDAKEWTTSVNLHFYKPGVERVRMIAHDKIRARADHDTLVARVRKAVEESEIPVPSRAVEKGKRMYAWTAEDHAAYREGSDYADRLAEFFYRET